MLVMNPLRHSNLPIIMSAVDAMAEKHLDLLPADRMWTGHVHSEFTHQSTFI